MSRIDICGVILAGRLTFPSSSRIDNCFIVAGNSTEAYANLLDGASTSRLLFIGCQPSLGPSLSAANLLND
jgi:hypothetical protein